MIMLTRLSGSGFVLNSDLIERVEETPDTVVTLVDGKKYVVAESPTQIVRAVREHRGAIVAISSVAPQADALEPAPVITPPHLAPVAALPVDHREP